MKLQFLIVSLILNAKVYNIDCQTSNALQKPKKLLMLGLGTEPPSPTGPTSFPSCAVALKVALDAVNANPNVLPDYNVEITFADEGPGAIMAPRQLLNFFNKYQTNLLNYKQNNTYLSPAMYGGGYACNTYSGIARYLNMVQFTFGCSGSLFTENRKRFPNLYRIVIPAEATILPMVSFAKYYGKWRQVAILSNSANSATDLMARQFHTVATRNGIEVVWFSGVPDVDNEVVSSLLNSDARVAAVFIIEPPILAKFLCFSYQQGIRGWRYAFLVIWRSIVDPYTIGIQLPPGCTTTMILEQMQITIYLGIITQQTTNYGPNSLGYDLVEFENRFNEKINYTRFWDIDVRQQCHDMMLETLFALDNSDRYLRRVHNLTLSDFNEYPETIMKVLNMSAASTNINSTRIGKMSYSKRLELDIEPIYAMQWQNRALQPKIQYDLKSADLASLSAVDLEIYTNKVLEPIVWATKSRGPPKDLSTLRIVNHLLPSYLKPIAWTTAFLLLAAKCYPVGRMIRSTNKIEHALLDIMLVGGCTALDIAALLFSLDPLGIAHCFAEILVTAVGLCLIHGCHATQLGVAAYVTKSTLEKRSSSAMSRSSIAIPHLKLNKREAKYLSAIKLTRFGSIFVIILNILVIAVWFAVGEVPNVVSFYTDIIYDNNDDSYFKLKTDMCFSTDSAKWIGSLAASHGLLLAMASCFGMQTRKFEFPAALSARLNMTRTATWNSTMLFLVLVLLQTVVPGNHAEIRADILSFGALLYSATNAVSLIVLAIPKVQLEERISHMPISGQISGNVKR